MTTVKLKLLQDELHGLEMAAGHLQYSLKMPEIYAAVAAMAPLLLGTVPKVSAYVKTLLLRYPS